MAYDEFLGERIETIMKHHKVAYLAKKMMGGLVFMVNEKMCCGIHNDKKYGDSLLMARIGEDRYSEEISKDVCLPMDFTGRPMKGFIYITPDGFDADIDLEYWVELALQYNREITGV